MENVSPATPRTSLTGPFSPEGPQTALLESRGSYSFDCLLSRMWPPHMLWAPGQDRLAVSDVWSLLSPPLRSTARTQARVEDGALQLAGMGVLVGKGEAEGLP